MIRPRVRKTLAYENSGPTRNRRRRVLLLLIGAAVMAISFWAFSTLWIRDRQREPQLVASVTSGHQSITHLHLSSHFPTWEQDIPPQNEDNITSFGVLKPQKNGKFRSGKAPHSTRPLSQKIGISGLEKVYLDHQLFGHSSHHQNRKGAFACVGFPCPDFDFCYKGFRDIGTCHPFPIKSTKQWAPQMFVLNRVFINIEGHVFNSTHLFDYNACPTEHKAPEYSPGSHQVVTIEDLVSLVAWDAWNTTSSLVDILPAMVALGPVVRALGDRVPVAYANKRGAVERNQMQRMQAIGLDEILGVDLEAWNPMIMNEGELYFAKRLFLPLRQRCGSPSHSLWRKLREDNFLRSDGLPIFDTTWKRRPVRKSVEVDSGDGDWFVLLGMKEGEKHQVLSLGILDYLKRLFPPSSVRTYYEGSIPMRRRKQLLNNAKLLIGIHGDVLADMLFMPPGGFVFEIRLHGEQDKSFHHLAEVCGLNYYSSVCDWSIWGSSRGCHMKSTKSIFSSLRSIHQEIFSSRNKSIIR